MKLIKRPAKIFSQIVSFPSKLLPSRWLRKMNSDQRRFFNLVVIGVILVGGTWVATSLLSPDRSEASWFNDNWLYRMSAEVTNATGSELTDFQVMIATDSAAMITQGKLQADCDDIRITDQSGKILPHWIETGANGCNTTTTNIWVKMNSIPTSGSTLLIYYGNPSATSTADGNKVFEFFDDFSGSSLDTTKWAGNTSNFTLLGGLMTGSNTTYRVQSVNSFTGNYRAISRSTTITDNVNGFMVIGFLGSTTNSFGILDHNNTSYYRNDSSWVNFAFDGTAQWSRNTVKVVGTSATYARVGETSGSSTASAINSGLSSETLALGTRYDNSATGQTYDTDWDWIIVTKAVTTEPTVSLGAEEKSPGPIAYWSMDEGSGGTVNDATDNDNNGTISGATWQEESMCLKGRCLFFDGTNDQVDFGNINNVPLAGDLTISFWIKPTNLAKGRQNPLGKSYGGEFDFTLETSGSLSYYHGPTGSNASPFYAYGSPVLSQNQWSHVTLTRDTTTRTVRYYINGKQQGTGTWTSDKDPSLSSRSFKFGYEYVGYYQGYLDEVKIYASARSQEQIKTDYNTGAAAVLGAKNSNLNNGLVGYWKLDESPTATASADDSSGKNNTGTAVDTSAVSGKFGYGRNFDGTGDYISVPSTSDLNFTTNGTFSISLWLKPDTLTSAWRRGIIRTENYLNSGYRFGMVSGGAPAFWTSQSGGSLSLTSSENMTVNQWNHVTVTYNNQQAYIYLNGRQTGSATGTYIAGTNSTILGYLINEYYSGTMEEVRIYNRALSPSEVTQLYSYAPPPIYYAPLDEGGGTTVNDLSGNGYTGSIIGSTPRWTQGKYGRALQFTNASADRVSANTTSGPLTYLNNHTVSFWAKFTDLNDGTYRSVFNHQPTGSDRSPGVWTHASAGTLRLHWLANPGNQGFGTLGTNGNGGTSFDTNKWYYLTVTKDGTTATAYVNGKMVGTGVMPAAMDMGTGIIRFGGGAGMLIDEIKVYNYPRTASQIIEDMNAGHPIGGSPVGSQLAHYQLDEGTGTTANDAVGTYNGTITAGTWTNAGKIGKALTFNGTTAYIDAGTTLSDVNTYGGAKGASTFTMWIYPTTDNTDRNIISMAGGWYYTGLNSSGKLQGMARDCTNNVNLWNYGSSVIPLNQWTHIAVELTGSGAKYYVNGKLDGSFSNLDTCLYHTGTARFGYSHVGWDYFSGKIDNIKVYATALTEEQIKIDYNSGQSLALGVLGTEADGTPSNSSDRAYCPPGDTTATCGPIGEWLFEERQGTSANDTSGNGHNGTLTGGPTWTAGKIGNALSFDGTDDYVDITDNNSLDLIGDMTMEAWVYPQNDADYNVIISKNSPGEFEMAADFRFSGAALATRWAGTPADFASFFSGYTDQWVHVMVTVSGTTVKAYRNGQYFGTSTGAARTATAYNVNIGRRTGSVFRWDGKIDQVRLFNYNLSSSQAAWSYNRGAPVAYYDLDECQGTTIHSFTKPYNSALNGTLTIGATGTQTTAGTCQTSGTAWGNGASGKINSSLNFDGTDDYFEISQPQIQTSPNLFTVAGWIKPGNQDSFFITPNSVGIDQWIAYDSTNQRLRVTVAEATDINQTNIYSVTGSVPFNTWAHYAVSINNRTVKIFINGKLSAESTMIFDIAGWTNNWRIGQRGNSTFWYQGLMDDLKIFNYELTPQQVRTVMNQGAIRFGQ